MIRLLQPLFVLAVTSGGLLAVAPVAAQPAAATTERVSVTFEGFEADGYSLAPALTDDGRYVAFTSSASNLVPGDINNARDVFLRDRLTGTTTLVSAAPGGTSGNGWSQGPAVSASGHVAFVSAADDLVPGDTNEAPDLFVFDRATGRIERVNVASDGGQSAGIWSGPEVALSDDGDVVAFVSQTQGLLTDGSSLHPQIVVKNLESGSVAVASRSTAGVWADRHSGHVDLSRDGGVVAFASEATNLVANDTNEVQDVFVHHLATGVTTRVTESRSGTDQAPPADLDHDFPEWSQLPSVSEDGRFVAFESSRSDLVAGHVPSYGDVFVADTASGDILVASTDDEGVALRGGSSPSISADGRYVAFASQGQAAWHHVYRKDLSSGALSLVSSARDGSPANGQSVQPDLTGDGRLVAFTSTATDLVEGDANKYDDIFVTDLAPVAAPPAPQYGVDAAARERASGPWSGVGVPGGTVEYRLTRDTSAVTALRLRNTGDQADQFMVSAHESGVGFSARWVRQGGDLGRDVSEGTFRTPVLEPGERFRMRLRAARTDAVNGSEHRVDITATSLADGAVSDTVTVLAVATRR